MRKGVYANSLRMHTALMQGGQGSASWNVNWSDRGCLKLFSGKHLTSVQGKETYNNSYFES